METPQQTAIQLCSIETTPSPNCIKLNLNQEISDRALTLHQSGDAAPLRAETLAPELAPELAQKLLAIEAVQSVFLFKDFITLTRKGNADWQAILARAARIIGVPENADARLLAQVSQAQNAGANSANSMPAADLGHVEVAIQMFRGIPVQVRVTAADGQQARVALPDRFNQALQRAIGATGANYVAERRWEPYPAPAGSPDEVARLVADEIAGLIDDEELAHLEAGAIANQTETADEKSQSQTLLTDLRHPHWKQRLKALQQLEVTPETFDPIVALLEDDQNTIRRWAAALLGASGMAEAVEPLCRVVLNDVSAIVRRTAGDALSDLGDSRAMATMMQALADSSRLVRWRAARFLTEMGDERAIESLHGAAQREAEFDVRVQMMAALERIEGGGDTQLPMWMRITQEV